MTDAAAPELFFLPQRDGQRLCVYHRPLVPVRGALVYVHPWAEEMNKSRRMAALQSRALAAAGYAVLQIDLTGCGDSSGDFGDATWDVWLDDIVAAGTWLAQRTDAPLWLWGLRAGCLLAAEAGPRLAQPCGHLHWQPAGAGKLLLQQFLRLKVAGALLDGGGKGVLDELRARLAGGEPVEIAGYRLSAVLAASLEAATLSPRGEPGRLEWIEVSSRVDASLSPASDKVVQAWRTAGWQTRTHRVTGPQFWQTTEIEVAPDLIQATIAALERGEAPAAPAHVGIACESTS
jgi:exosortase A-associated hydrolase 2